jgi:hypothetical protein
MALCIAWGEPGSKFPSEWTYEGQLPSTGGKIDPKTKVLIDDRSPVQKLVIRYRWDSTGNFKDDDAQFRAIQQKGIPGYVDPAFPGSARFEPQKGSAPSRVWRYRGVPAYVDNQARRFRATQLLAKVLHQNRELHKMEGQMGELSNRIMQQRGLPLNEPQIKDVMAILAQCERQVQGLHILAAAGAQAVDEAIAAFGLEMPPREYVVLSVFDEVAQTNGHAPVQETKNEASSSKGKK